MKQQINNRIREEFDKWFEDETEYTATTSEISTWWLSKIDELLKSQRVEHCSEPKCPECNLVAYQKGREDAKKELEEAHETNNGWCCACEYDQIKLEDKLKSQREEVLKVVVETERKWIEDNWINFYESSKPLADFKKELLRKLNLLSPNKENKNNEVVK